MFNEHSLPAHMVALLLYAISSGKGLYILILHLLVRRYRSWPCYNVLSRNRAGSFLFLDVIF